MYLDNVGSYNIDNYIRLVLYYLTLHLYMTYPNHIPGRFMYYLGFHKLLPYPLH